MTIQGLGSNSSMDDLLQRMYGAQKTENAKGTDGTNGVNGSPTIPDARGADSSGDTVAPDMPKGNVNMLALNDWVCATPSPGALLAAACVKDAAQQYEQNQNLIYKSSQDVQKNILEQAKDIKNGALKQFIFSVAGASISAVGSAISAYKVGKLDTGLDQNAFTKMKSAADNWSTAGKIGETTLNSIGTYLNAREQSDVKKLDAAIEQHRTQMESLKNSSQASSDLMRKAIECMDALQSNANQTRTRILG